MSSKLTFDEWKNTVDMYLESRCGFSSEDLPLKHFDFDGRYHRGVSSLQTAEDCLKAISGRY